MKKALYILTLSILLFLGGTAVQAQGLTITNDRPEDIAKAKVSMLDAQLDLSGDQQRALFRAYVKREVDYKKYIADKDTNSSAVKQQKTKIKNNLENAVKKELTAEQFAQWEKEFKNE